MKFYSDEKKIIDVKIVSRQGNFHTILLPSGVQIPNVFSWNKFPVGGFAKAARSNFGNYFLLGERIFTYPKSEINLYIVTYDSGNNEKVLIHDGELFGKNCFSHKETDGITLQDIAAIKNYSYYGYGFASIVPAMISNSDPEPFIVSASSQETGYEAYKCFDQDNNTLWRSSGTGPHTIKIDLGESKVTRAIKITSSGQPDAAKELEIQASYEDSYYFTEITENLFLDTYGDYWYHVDLNYQYIQIQVNSSLDGSSNTSIGAIQLYEWLPDPQIISSPEVGDVQSDEGTKFVYESSQGKDGQG